VTHELIKHNILKFKRQNEHLPGTRRNKVITRSRLRNGLRVSRDTGKTTEEETKTIFVHGTSAYCKAAATRQNIIHEIN